MQITSTGKLTVAGLCRDGMDEGAYGLYFLSALDAGGKEAQKVVSSAVVQRIISVVRAKWEDMNVRPTDTQLVHLLWMSTKVKDITAVNKSAADCGFLTDHSDKVTEKSVKSDDGTVMTYDEADDERLQKDVLNIGFLYHNLRRLREGWTIVHGKEFADKVYDGWTALAEGMHNAVSDMGAASHSAIALGLQRSYQEMSQSIRTSLREAPSGRSAGEFAQERLVVQPSNWATMSSTLAVKALTAHMNASLQDAKAAGKRSAQGDGGQPTKLTRRERRAAKKHKKNLQAKRATEREEENEEAEEEEGEKAEDEKEDEDGED